MSAASRGDQLSDRAEVRSAFARWIKRTWLRLDRGRAREWCERNIPHLSRPFLKYGRDYPLGLIFSLVALYSFGQWWAWFHRTGPVGVALAWTAVAAVPLLLAKRWWVVTAFLPGWVAAQSYFHFAVEGRPAYLLVGTASLGGLVFVLGLGSWLGLRRRK